MTSALDALDVLPIRIRVASIVRKAILSGDFKAGRELSLTDLSARLGVSRTPVREALQMLEGEGLVALRMNKSAIVNAITTDMIRDHYEMRRLLEGEAVAKATANGMDVEELAKLHARVLERGDALASEDYRKYNQLFHTSIWKASGSDKLSSFLTMLWNGSSFSRAVSEESHRVISLEEHGRMLDRMRAGDIEAARREMERHIVRSMQNILDGYAMDDVQMTDV